MPREANKNELYSLKRQFLEYCELDKGQSQLTISGYDRYLERFFQWLVEYRKQQSDAESGATAQTELTPEMIDQEAIRQYRLHVNRLKEKNGHDLKQSTQNFHLLAIRAFLKYLDHRGVKSISPEKVSIAKTGDREITFLDGEELEKILSLPDISEPNGLRDKVILEMLFSTGLRVSELAALDVSDINFERGEIAVLGKGRKLRVVFLSESSLVALDNFLKSRGYSDQAQRKSAEAKGVCLFVSNKHTRLSVRSIERIVQKYASLAGLTKHVSPHTLRHSFATDLLMSGADIRSVQSLLGHSSITTTQVYTHVTDQHLREIHQAFHGKRRTEVQPEEPAKELP